MSDNQREEIQEISVSEIFPFKNHPFRVIDDESMQRTVESVSQFGVLVPGIVRPRPEGGYEMISGHRRLRACQLTGKNTIPVIVRQMDDDSAIIAMVDSNLQRETLLPSERAFAYKMKMEAMARRVGRPSRDNRGQVDHNLKGKKTRDIIAEQTGESARQIQRYVSLTNLIPDLLEMVDSKELAFNPAVEISHLKPEEQEGLYDAMEYSQSTPSLSQAQRLHKLSQVGLCTQEKMNDLMSEEKKGELDRVTFESDDLRQYFPKTYTPRQMREVIIKLLEQWQKKRQHEQSR